MKERGHLCILVSFLSIILALLLLSGSVVSASQKSQKRILLLYSHEKTLPGQELIDNGIRSVIRTDPTFEIELFHEYLDFAHFDQPGYQESLARFLGDKYSVHRPDLIISVLPQSLSYLLSRRQQIFPGVPVVVCTVFESSVKALEGTEDRQEITGVTLKEDTGDIVPLVRKLRPNFRRIALVGGHPKETKSIQR